MRFDTAMFELTHGRKPSGVGGWVFRDKDRNDPPVHAPKLLPLTLAKILARQALPKASTIEVMP